MSGVAQFGAWVSWLLNAMGLFLVFAAVYGIWRWQTSRRMMDDPDFVDHRLAAKYFAKAKAEHRRGKTISARAYHEMACELDPEYRGRNLDE